MARTSRLTAFCAAGVCWVRLLFWGQVFLGVTDETGTGAGTLQPRPGKPSLLTSVSCPTCHRHLFLHMGVTTGGRPRRNQWSTWTPPYAGTTGYTSERAGVPKFDHDEFWATATRWAQSGVHVFVSEFNAPEGWTPIWERERSVGVGGFQNAGYTKKTDKLFVYGKGYK